MGMETATLIINQIEWQYQKSNEPTPDRQPSLKKVGIKSMEVKCKNCGHQWSTRKGYKSGDFNLEILIWRLGMRFLTARYAVRLTQSHLKSLIRNIRNGEAR